MPTQPQPQPHIVLSLEKKVPKKALVLPDWLPQEVWINWLAHRNSGKKRLTEHAQQLHLNELTKLREQGQDPVAVIEKSIMRGWMGLFAIEERQNGNATNRTSSADDRGQRIREKGDRATTDVSEELTVRLPG
jgi:hypothetical protein